MLWIFHRVVPLFFVVIGKINIPYLWPWLPGPDKKIILSRTLEWPMGRGYHQVFAWLLRCWSLVEKNNFFWPKSNEIHALFGKMYVLCEFSGNMTQTMTLFIYWIRLRHLQQLAWCKGLMFRLSSAAKWRYCDSECQWLWPLPLPLSPNTIMDETESLATKLWKADCHSKQVILPHSLIPKHYTNLDDTKSLATTLEKAVYQSKRYHSASFTYSKQVWTVETRTSPLLVREYKVCLQYL